MNTPRSEQAPTLDDLRHQLNSLRNMLQALLIVLLVMSASLNIFLLRQVTIVHRELKQRRETLQQYESKGYPLLRQFLDKMESFSQTNADFAPILRKYFPVESNAVPGDLELSPPAEPAAEAEGGEPEE